MQAHNSVLAITAYLVLLPAGTACLVWSRQISGVLVRALAILLRPLAPWMNESFRKATASKTLATRVRYGIAAVFLVPVIQLMALSHPLNLRIGGALLTVFSVYHLWQLAHVA